LKENTRFFLKVTTSHVLTYILCGMIAQSLFSYWNWIGEQTNWRKIDDSIILQLLPIFQLLRGILYGIALFLIKDSIVYSKYGFLKLYLIMIIIGIFNTPAPSPGSIEAFIYLIPSNAPLGVKIGGMAEILIQNLLFCLIVCKKWRELKNKIIKNK